MGDYEEVLRRVQQRQGVKPQPQYLADVYRKVQDMLANNLSEDQLQEQQKIDAYLKVYADRPDKIQEILKALELYQQNDWQPAQPIKRWY